MPMELPLQNTPDIYTRIQKICEYYEVDMYSDFLTFYSYEILFCKEKTFFSFKQYLLILLFLQTKINKNHQ